MHKLSAGRTGYFLGLEDAPSEPVDATVIRDAGEAFSVLQRCVGDYHAMRMLRSHVSDVQRSETVHHLSDVEVVDLAARLVGWGRLRLLGPVPRLRRLARIGSGGAAAEEPERAAPSVRAASSAPVEAAAPSFIPNLDSALLASMLRDASNDGTPFCEECARAARAA